MARWVPGRGHLANAKGPGQLKYFSKETLEGLDVSTAEVVASMEYLIALQAKDKAWVFPFFCFVSRQWAFWQQSARLRDQAYVECPRNSGGFPSFETTFSIRRVQVENPGCLAVRNDDCRW